MSRGIGRLQVAVLDLLDQQPDGFPARILAQRLHGAAPTVVQLRSVRRALASLRRRGLVEEYSWWDAPDSLFMDAEEEFGTYQRHSSKGLAHEVHFGPQKVWVCVEKLDDVSDEELDRRAARMKIRPLF